MEDRPIENMSETEFEAFLDRIATGEFEDLTLPSFLDTLWALQAARAEEVIEMTVTMEGEQVSLDGPQGVIVHGNELVVGGKRLVFKAGAHASST